MSDEVCSWSAYIDRDYGLWETSCGEAFALNDGTPIDNGMKYCCYCGCKLVQFIEELK